MKSKGRPLVTMAISIMVFHQLCHLRACSTSVAVGVKQGCGVRETSAVGVVVYCAHARLVSTAVFPGDIDRVADAAVGEPAGVTLVQAGLPGEVKLSDGSQLSSQHVAMCGSCSQTEFLWHCGVEDLTWKKQETKKTYKEVTEQSRSDSLKAFIKEFVL